MKTTTKKVSLFAGGIVSIALSLMTLSLGASNPAYATSSTLRGPQAIATGTDVPTPTPPLTAFTVTPPSTPPPDTSGFADPYVLKSVNASQMQAGDTVQFTIVAGNRGNVDAVNVQVRDTLESYFDLVSVTASPRGTVILNGRSFIVDIGTLSPKELITIVVIVKVNDTAKAGVCMNVATLNTTSTGDDPNNNIAFAKCIMGQVMVPETGADLTAPTSQMSTSQMSTSQMPIALALLVFGVALVFGSLWVGRRHAA